MLYDTFDENPADEISVGMFRFDDWEGCLCTDEEIGESLATVVGWKKTMINAAYKELKTDMKTELDKKTDSFAEEIRKKK